LLAEWPTHRVVSRSAADCKGPRAESATRSPAAPNIAFVVGTLMVDYGLPGVIWLMIGLLAAVIAF
jgi:hypothetical protein